MATPPQVWREHKTPEGRPYYSNGAETTWIKPIELMPPGSATQPWRESSDPKGKPYYFNSETKETQWVIPESLAHLYESSKAQSFQPQDFVAGSFSNVPSQTGPARDRNDRGHDQRSRFESAKPSVAIPTAPEPDYPTFESAEAAFHKLLKRVNVQSDWTWQQTMKEAIKYPEYRALKDPKERKAAFEKFIIDARQQEKEREKERLAKLRSDFGKMLSSHPEIKHYTRWKTAHPIIEGETIFKAAADDAQRQQLYNEYIVSLKRANVISQDAKREAENYEITEILRSLDLKPYTRWSDAQKMIDKHERYQQGDGLKALSRSDVLNAFVDHMRTLETAYYEHRKSEKNAKVQDEQLSRNEFVTLLQNLKQNGMITADTKWKEIQPLIHDDPKYVAMLGHKGSNQLELFWDTIEEEEQRLRPLRHSVLDVLDNQGVELTMDLAVEDIIGGIRADLRTSNLSESDLKLVLIRLKDKMKRQEEEEKRKVEREQSRKIDALRSRIKRLHPLVTTADDWEDVRPRLEKYDEYHALKSDDARKTAFDKFIRRLKEREEEDSYRDRTRGRNGDRYGSRYSRTPEHDAYEADRRKAQADRERQYRRQSARESSPTGDRRRDRERDDRDRRDRYGRRYSGHDFRDRMEFERERPPESRADRFSSFATRQLDYGDDDRSNSATTGRRRRTSEESSRGERESKRPRRDKSSNTPREPTPATKEEENLKSGSEEGEIEEV